MSKPMPATAARIAAAAAATLLAGLAGTMLEGVPWLVVLTVGGVAAGLLSPAMMGLVGGLVGFAASYPAALATGRILFLGDGWQVTSIVGAAAVAIGWLAGRTLAVRR